MENKTTAEKLVLLAGIEKNLKKSIEDIGISLQNIPLYHYNDKIKELNKIYVKDVDGIAYERENIFINIFNGNKYYYPAWKITSDVPNNFFLENVIMSFANDINIDILEPITSNYFTYVIYDGEYLYFYLNASYTVVGNIECFYKIDKDFNVIIRSTITELLSNTIKSDGDYIYNLQSRCNKFDKETLTLVASSANIESITSNGKILINNNYIFLIFSGAQKIYKINKETLAIIDITTFGEQVATVVAKDEYIYYYLSSDKSINKVHENDLSTILYKHILPTAIRELDIYGDYIYVSLSSFHELAKISLVTWEKTTIIKLSSGAFFEHMVFNDNILTTSFYSSFLESSTTTTYKYEIDLTTDTFKVFDMSKFKRRYSNKLLKIENYYFNIDYLSRFREDYNEIYLLTEEGEV